MGVIAVEVVLIIVLVAINGVLAMSEMALVSSRKARLRQQATAGDPRARLALELAEEPGQFLSTVQIGITLVGILAGAFGGATVAEVIGDALQSVPALAPYSEAVGLALVVAAITYFSLVFGELVPKRIALNNPERIVLFVVRPMRVLASAAAPAVRLLSFSTEVVLRLLGIRPSNEPPVTEDEVKVLIEQGASAGVFAETERELVTSIFRLGDLRVSSVMTPRPDIEWLDLDDSPDVILTAARNTVRSVLPVARGGLDEVIGIVRAKDILSTALAGQPIDLVLMAQAPLFVPTGVPALQLLDRFRQARTRLALVVDEFGGVEGLVTTSDVLEAIGGELPEPHDDSAPEVVRREDGSLLLDGALPIDRLDEAVGARVTPADERGYYGTVAGFLLMRLGHIPRAGDYVDWSGHRFEVVDMDGRRIDKVLVKQTEATEHALSEQASL